MTSLARKVICYLFSATCFSSYISQPTQHLGLARNTEFSVQCVHTAPNDSTGNGTGRVPEGVNAIN